MRNLCNEGASKTHLISYTQHYTYSCVRKILGLPMGDSNPH